MPSSIETNSDAIEGGAVRVRPLRGEGFFKAANRIIPLNRAWHPLLAVCNASEDLISIPFMGLQLVHPAAWRKELMAFLLAGENAVPEFPLARKLLRENINGAIVDVGANIGLYLMLFRSVSDREIVAFEPVKLFYEIYKRNVIANYFQGVEVVNKACGLRSGEVLMESGMNAAIVPGGNAAEQPCGSSDFNSEAMAAKTGNMRTAALIVALDDVLNQRAVGLIKIDCEGFELDVLRGAERVIYQNRPRIFIEIHPTMIEQYGGSVQQVLDFLDPIYEMEFWDFDQFRHRSKIIRSWSKHRPNAGTRIPGASAFISVCGKTPRPTQVYLVARPK